QGKDSGPFAGQPLLMSAETQQALQALWGEPAAGAVQVAAPDELVDLAWAQQPSWAIVPFEQLAPRWKVLAIDGQSPIWKDLDAATYALALPITLAQDANWPPLAETGVSFPASNRDADKLTTVIMTGVTALVRATAWEMERKGIT